MVSDNLYIDANTEARGNILLNPEPNEPSVDLGGDTTVRGDVMISQRLSVSLQVDFRNDLSVAHYAYLGKHLSVTNNGYFGDALSVNKYATV